MPRTSTYFYAASGSLEDGTICNIAGLFRLSGDLMKEWPNVIIFVRKEFRQQLKSKDSFSITALNRV